MKFRTSLNTLLLFSTLSTGIAQVASHAPSPLATPPAPAASQGGAMDLSRPEVKGKPVIRVNGRVLTDRDLLHEMYALFPYAAQHNGFPKSMESDIRKGAEQMLVFEELVYQEGERRKIVIAPQRINAAEADLRKGFGGDEGFKEYLRAECNGSRQVLREKIRRSLLIDTMLQREVSDKSTPTPIELRAYYNKNAQQFTHGETYHLQTISIIPPANAGAEAKQEGRRHAEDAYKAAKNSKSFQEFGLLAEKYSDDDWHVSMGNRVKVEKDKLPPPVVSALMTMKPGDVSPLIQLGDNYTIVRLVARKPAGKDTFLSVRKKLATELKKAKTDALRAQLDQRLHKAAKVEEL
jgi:peptidyl-prolyl cis-trans isomerase SurA